MKRQGARGLGLFSVVAGVAVALVLAVTPGRSAGAPFDELHMFIEYNSTDEDAGIQVFLDGEGWKELVIRRNGQVILEIEAERGPFKRTGLTEIRMESAEPDPDKIFARFPEGIYHFVAKKVDGGQLVGTVNLSHDLPPAPCLFSLSNTGLLTWDLFPAGGNQDCLKGDFSGDEDVESYEVIVENETLGTKIETNVPASTMQVQIPPHVFGNPATHVIHVEVLAVGENGNKTIAEVKDFFENQGP